MTLRSLLEAIHNVLRIADGKELYEAVAYQSDSRAWWAFGRDTNGDHCLYLALPLSAHQVTQLSTEDVLLTDGMLKDAVKTARLS